MHNFVLDGIYLLSAVLFIIGIKMLSSPETAVKGNYTSAVAMALAVGVTLITGRIPDFTWVVVGLVVGAVVGIVASRIVKMTDMPQMVALYNGLGGAASALVATSEYYRDFGTGIPVFILSVIMLSLFVGSLTFTGSLVAFAKLQELVSGKPTLFPGQHIVNLVLGIVAAVAGVMLVATAPLNVSLYLAVAIVALVLGVLLVIPIGGADMPVVIALLNSYSGIAVSFTGFVLSNNALIITGSLVGASGLFLTNEMCKGMNRSIWNVLFGGFGADQPEKPSGDGAEVPQGAPGEVTSGQPEDGIKLMLDAKRVILVPGYGMAAAQAQHAVRDLGDALDQRGVDVKYAVHPVAGRMPGHMNVLLAEANVPYDLLFDMDDINEDFPETDVVLVVGANDVVNPAADEDPSSPIYGMPILHADQAKRVIVLKRSMNPGFAGIDNMLFYRENTMMIFGDARDTLTKLADGVKSA